MKAISFLGATQAYETTYVMPDGREHTAPYFPAALVRFYQVDALLVFVTADARRRHFDALVRQAEDFAPTITPVDIPDGRTEAELWQIFQAVADAVTPGDRLIFDITHGFRSLPFLSFLAAAYLRAMKDVTLESVLYGALEAGDRTVMPARAPVFDLTRFVTLLDWLTAADRFTRFGDAGDLAALLRDPHAIPVHLAARTERDARGMAGLLRGAATAVEEVSEPLRLVRPLEMMGAASRLNAALDRARGEIEQAAPPFALIADQVGAAYAPFGLAQPTDPACAVACLDVQRDLVTWYVERRQYAHAILLAREWVVSYGQHLLERELLSPRKRAEDLLNLAVEARKEHCRCAEETDIPHFAAAVDVWSKVRELRNDLAHIGMRPHALRVASLAAEARSLPGELATLPLEEKRP